MHRPPLLSKYMLDPVCTSELSLPELHERPSAIVPMVSSILACSVLLLVFALTAKVVQLSADTMVVVEASKSAFLYLIFKKPHFRTCPSNDL